MANKLSPKEMARLWHKSWKDYIKAVDKIGYERRSGGEVRKVCIRATSQCNGTE